MSLLGWLTWPGLTAASRTQQRPAAIQRNARCRRRLRHRRRDRIIVIINRVVVVVIIIIIATTVIINVIIVAAAADTTVASTTRHQRRFKPRLTTVGNTSATDTIRVNTTVTTVTVVIQLRPIGIAVSDTSSYRSRRYRSLCAVPRL